MRIAIFTNEFPSLSETFIASKVWHLAQRGHQVRVYCSRIHPDLFPQGVQEGPRIGTVVLNRTSLLIHILLHPFLLSRRGLKGPAGNGKKQLRTHARVDLIARYQPDIVHFEFSGIGIAYLEEIGLLNCQTVVSCRGTAEKVKLWQDDTRKELTRRLFDKVDAIHCVSRDMRETILPFVSSPEKIFINFPSIDTLYFKRSRPLQSGPVLRMISVGRLTFQKGYLNGLLAVRLLKSWGLAFRWVIVGKGPQEEEIRFHIREMGLEQEVILSGARSTAEILELYEESDLFFLPSVYEGIANAALEAMSMELGVVATRSGGMDEVIDHGRNGWLAAVYDPASLAGGIRELALDFPLRKQLGIAARATVREGFDIRKQIDLFERQYRELLGNSPAG